MQTGRAASGSYQHPRQTRAALCLTPRNPGLTSISTLTSGTQVSRDDRAVFQGYGDRMERLGQVDVAWHIRDPETQLFNE